jgi:hypothetical protein
MKKNIRESTSLVDLIKKFEEKAPSLYEKNSNENSTTDPQIRLTNFFRDELMHRVSDPRKGPNILSEEESFYLIHNLKRAEVRVGGLISGKITQISPESITLEYRDSGLKIIVNDFLENKDKLGDTISVKVKTIVYKKSKVVATAKPEELLVTEKIIFDMFFAEKSQRSWSIFKKTFRPCKNTE